MEKQIKIIDIFAGPGGLGEGFSSYKIKKQKPFKIAVSIEKEQFAHQTLLLRSFFRQFKNAPEHYYKYARGEITKKELFDKYPEEYSRAEKEAIQAELGSEKFPDDVIINKIRSQIEKNDECILIGGPPCQAYSLAGRSAMRNRSEFDKDPRHTLYKQYLKILANIKPSVFVMENVKGILSSKHEGEFIFNKILEDLRAPVNAVRGTKIKKSKETYTIYSLSCDKSPEDLVNADFIIKADEYGIPQTRHRVILLGIRNDINVIPKTLKKTKDKITVKEVIGDLPKLRSGLSKGCDNYDLWAQAILKEYNDANLYKDLDRNYRLIKETSIPSFNKTWFYDAKLKTVLNHETRSHIVSDLHRYYYYAKRTEIEGVSPKLDSIPRKLLPNHKNVNKNENNEDLAFGDRFKVQAADQPATTITSHISKDGHYFIHYDSQQCRSLTVREAARIQTFPDNYKFEGPRTSQYQQVGNAVPPLLARQIAEIVYEILLQSDQT